MGKEIDYDYINENINIFQNHIISNFGIKFMEDIKWITKSLLISLIPLHKKENSSKFFDLIKILK
jgi:hypothetical protein